MVDAESLTSFDVSNSDDSDIVFVEQFVQDVIGFSSQYGSDISISYTAYNITGKPSKFPDYGDFPQAFVMARRGKGDVLLKYFVKPQYRQSVPLHCFINFEFVEGTYKRTYGKWWNEAPSGTPPFMPQSLGKVTSQDFIDLLFEEAVYPFRVSVFETYNPGSVVRIWAVDHQNQWRLLWEGEPQHVGHTPRVFSPVIQTINSPTKLLRLEFDHSHLEYYTELDAVLLVGTKEPIVSPETHQLPSCDLILPTVGKLTSQILQLNIHNIPPQVDIPNSIVNFLDEELPLLLKGTGEAGQVMVPPTKCAQVSKRFHDLATDSLLYTELNLKVYWYRVTATALKSLSKQCQYLQKLDLSWCGDFNHITSEDFVAFIEVCGSQLTHLRLNSCKFADDCCAMKIAEKCKNLKELSLRSCHNITELGFQSIAFLKNLQYLDLYRTLIDLGPLKAILKSSPHLKHINMGSCVHISSMDDIAQTLATYNKELVSVDFWKTYSLTPIGVRALRKCRKLEEVDLGWCLGVGAPGDSLHSLATGCPCLRKLFLAALRGITDRDLEPFIEHCPGLEQVDLLGVRSITSDICIKFLTRCTKLRLLDVSFCDQVQDSEVACWRMVFPHISIKRSFQHDIMS